MLREAITYLTTPCPAPFRTVGYLGELIATEARYRRCRQAWQPHLDRTKALISEAAAGRERRHAAVVLGAGILADIPLDVLAGTFQTVTLVDVCFLRATRRAAGRFGNVTLRTADLTGVAEKLAAGDMPAPAPPTGLGIAHADLVVAANILSQLPLIPTDFLRRTRPALGDDAVFAFGQAIVRAHLDWLATCAGTVCLISEVERRVLTDGHVEEREDPLWGVPFEASGQEWFWDMAPRGEIAPDVEIRNRVRAVIRR